MIRSLVQYQDAQGTRRVGGCDEQGQTVRLRACDSAYGLLHRGLLERITLEELIADLTTEKSLDVARLATQGRLLDAIDHPVDSRHCFVWATGPDGELAALTDVAPPASTANASSDESDAHDEAPTGAVGAIGAAGAIEAGAAVVFTTDASRRLHALGIALALHFIDQQRLALGPELLLPAADGSLVARTLQGTARWVSGNTVHDSSNWTANIGDVSAAQLEAAAQSRAPGDLHIVLLTMPVAAAPTADATLACACDAFSFELAAGAGHGT